MIAIGAAVHADHLVRHFGIGLNGGVDALRLSAKPAPNVHATIQA
jgi:hypothetical protein